MRPIRSSRRYPRTRIRLGPIDVRSVAHESRLLAAPGPSGRAIEAISEITESRQDELLRVQLAIDHGREDGDARMRGFDRREALRRRDDADQADVFHAGLLEQRDGGDRASA